MNINHCFQSAALANSKELGPETFCLKTMSAQDDETQTLAQPTCIKCDRSVDPSDVVSKGYGIQRRSCCNLYQVLYRHMGGLPPTIVSMSAKAQAEFFRKMSDQVKNAPKNARWKLIRAGLVTSMTSWHQEQTKLSVVKEYLPLSVWQQRGFDIEKIQLHGEKQEDRVA